MEISKSFSVGDFVKDVTKVENCPGVVQFFKIESITDTAVTLVELKYGEELKHYVREPLDFVTRPKNRASSGRSPRSNPSRCLVIKGSLCLAPHFLISMRSESQGIPMV